MSTDLDLPLVVLTGASGFVGSQALDYLLKQNYRVLAPVRSVSRLSYQKALYENTPYAARVQYVEVPDQSVPSAFDNILTGAEAIIHNATIDPRVPAVAAEVPEKLITPVVDMAKAIFLAALEVPSIKRFVYVGSSVSVVNGDILDGKRFTEEDWTGVTVEDAVRAGGGVVAYTAAKTLAEKKIWELTEERKPGFEVVVLNPPGMNNNPRFRAVRVLIPGQRLSARACTKLRRPRVLVDLERQASRALLMEKKQQQSTLHRTATSCMPLMVFFE